MSDSSAAPASGSIIQSPTDKREYRYLTLPENQLRVLLIHDAETEKASAALDIRVGSYSDQTEGEAHFLEHCLFLGTEKYPGLNDYSAFLSKSGGSSNAYTDLEDTNYFFDVTANELEGALDRFAQFFIAPLMNKDALERERNAVDSEHAKNLQSDMWRIYQLTKSLSRSDHPYSKFGTGNAESLANVLDIEKFYKQEYSANRMALCVLGTQTLDELESMVKKYFTEVPNKSLQHPISFPGEPFKDLLPLQLQVVPVKETLSLEMQFPMREVLTLYKSKPLRYLSHLLGHESKGSILSLLKERQWANDLSAGESRACSDWTAFGISIVLTEAGFEHWKDVVQIVFAYLHMLRDAGPQEWIYNETANVAECGFRFISKRDAIDYTCSLVSNMHQYEPEHVLSGAYLCYEYNPEHISECLSFLRPDNMLLISSSGKAFTGKTSETEKWYGVEYNKDPLSTELIDLWNNAPLIPELHLPERNDMIASNFELVSDKNLPVDHPVLLMDRPTCRLWYKPDNVFHMPKASMLVEIQTTAAYESPAATVLSTLYQLALEEAMNEFLYLASMAGLHCGFTVTRNGLEIQVSGYNDKLDRLVDRVVKIMVGLELTEEVCSRLKDKLKKQFQNFLVTAPYQHAIYATDLLLLEQKWSIEEKLAALEQITCQDILSFGAKCFSVSPRAKLELLIHGNIAASQAQSLANLWIEGLNVREPFSSPSSRVGELPLNRDVVYRFKEFNPDNTNSVTEVVYQMGALSIKESAHLSMLSHLIKEPFFNELRTQEALGYIVHSSLHASSNIKGLMFLIQSDSHDPVHLDERISAFLVRFREKLVTMSTADFDANIEALVQVLLEKNRNLTQESGKYWDAISSKRHYEFHRMKNIANSLEKEVTLTTILRFFDKYIPAGAPRRRKLSVQVFSGQHEGRMVSPIGEEVELVLDGSISNFKRSCPLYPLPKTVNIDSFKMGVIDNSTTN